MLNLKKLTIRKLLNYGCLIFYVVIGFSVYSFLSTTSLDHVVESERAAAIKIEELGGGYAINYRGISNLESITLAGTRVTDQDLAFLFAELQHLKSVNLTDTTITDLALDYAIKHPTLRLLNLKNTKVTPRAIRLISDKILIEDY